MIRDSKEGVAVGAVPLTAAFSILVWIEEIQWTFEELTTLFA